MLFSTVFQLYHCDVTFFRDPWVTYKRLARKNDLPKGNQPRERDQASPFPTCNKSAAGKFELLEKTYNFSSAID